MMAQLAVDDRAAIVAGLERGWATGERFEIDTTLVSGAEETIDVALGVHPERDADGHVIALSGTVQDVTARKLLEKQLIQAQKMEGLGRMAGGIAHDINNTLVGVLSFISLAKDTLPSGTTAHEDLELALDAANQAAKVVAQTLSFARPAPGRQEVIDIDHELREVAQLLVRLLGDRCKLDLRLSGDLWPVRFGAGQVAQVVTNLVLNASDAMPEGGRVTISTRNLESKDMPRSLAARSEPCDSVVLTVADEGEGIAPQDLTNILEPF